MRPSDVVEILIAADEPLCARDLIEASVHLPRRSSRYVAAFRDENGRPVWRTTGLRQRGPALALAKRWEAEAKRKRAAQPAGPRKPTIRVRRASGERELGLRSQEEVALAMKISTRAVREIERRAFEKIRQQLKQFWNEFTSGDIKEAALSPSNGCVVSRAEIAAVYALAQTPAERHALTKLLNLITSHGA
jgi:hypothetical protein